MPEITIPESPLVVETETINTKETNWDDEYVVRVLCGPVLVFERVYREYVDSWSDEVAYSQEDAKEQALKEFGNLLKNNLGL